jgi:hypothetical protein
VPVNGLSISLIFVLLDYVAASPARKETRDQSVWPRKLLILPPPANACFFLFGVCVPVQTLSQFITNALKPHLPCFPCGK